MTSVTNSTIQRFIVYIPHPFPRWWWTRRTQRQCALSVWLVAGGSQEYKVSPGDTRRWIPKHNNVHLNKSVNILFLSSLIWSQSVKRDVFFRNFSKNDKQRNITSHACFKACSRVKSTPNYDSNQFCRRKGVFYPLIVTSRVKQAIKRAASAG